MTLEETTDKYLKANICSFCKSAQRCREGKVIFCYAREAFREGYKKGALEATATQREINKEYVEVVDQLKNFIRECSEEKTHSHEEIERLLEL